MIKILRGLVVNSFYLYLIQGVNALLPLLVLPYLLKTLSSESFGIFAYSQAFVQFLILFVDFGFNLSVAKQISSLQEDSEEVVRLYWVVSAVKLLFFSLVTLLTLVFFLAVPALHIYKTAVLFSMVTLLGSVLFPLWLYQGLNKVRVMSIINLLAKLCTIPLVFVLVRDSGDYLPAVILHAASYLVAGMVAAALVLSQRRFRRLPLHGVNAGAMKQQIREAWPIFLSSSSVTLYTSSLTIILGFVASPGQVGLFGALERVVRAICFGVYVPISQAVFPVLARLAHTDFSTARRIFRIVLYFTAAVMLGIFLVMVLAQHWIMRHFFSGFGDISSLFRFALLTIIPIAIGGICGQLGLLALGRKLHKAVYSKVYVYVGFASLPISLLAIWWFKAGGAVFSMFVTEAAVCIGMFIFVRKIKLI